MNFILWTLVWWGLYEIQFWKIPREEVKKNPWATVISYAITWILYIYLYKTFIQ